MKFNNLSDFKRKFNAVLIRTMDWKVKYKVLKADLKWPKLMRGHLGSI